MNEQGRTTIHYTELPPAKPGESHYLEWETYRREVGRWLAEGLEGKWVLLKDEQVIGMWDTMEEAEQVALRKYLLEPCLIHQILTREPLVFMSRRYWQCQG